MTYEWHVTDTISVPEKACKDAVSGAWGWAPLVLVAGNANLQQGLKNANGKRRVDAERHKKIKVWHFWKRLWPFRGNSWKPVNPLLTKRNVNQQHHWETVQGEVKKLKQSHSAKPHRWDLGSWWCSFHMGRRFLPSHIGWNNHLERHPYCSPPPNTRSRRPLRVSRQKDLSCLCVWDVDDFID